jgi:hypothetical protein
MDDDVECAPLVKGVEVGGGDWNSSLDCMIASQLEQPTHQGEIMRFKYLTNELTLIKREQSRQWFHITHIVFLYGLPIIVSTFGMVIAIIVQVYHK